MSFGKALYFPYIHFRDENWLKYTLLYWDGVKRIVPPSYALKDSEAVRQAVAEGLIENVNPRAGNEGGAKSYAEGTMKEFIPTIQTLKEQRGGHLGRGSSITLRVEGNAAKSMVHIEKMDSRVAEMLKESDLVREDGEWYSMQSDLAGYYMLCLAAHISERQRAPLVSDSVEMETGGSYFQHSRHSSTPSPRQKDVSFQLARLVIPVPSPTNLANCSMRKILEFHAARADERRQFRGAIEKMVEGAGALNDLAATKDFLEEKKSVIRGAMKAQKLTMQDLGVEVKSSLMAVSVPSGIAALASGFEPVSMALMGGGALLLSFVSWFTKARGEKRKAIRESDWHYLLQVEQEFSPKSVAQQGQQSFDQFVCD
jgi:hypothetical protein